MTAPYEVWVAYQITAPNADGLAMPKNTVLGPNPNIRYLRADLTCGECSEFSGGSSCPHWSQEWEGCSGTSACMAFQPKESK